MATSIPAMRRLAEASLIGLALARQPPIGTEAEPMIIMPIVTKGGRDGQCVGCISFAAQIRWESGEGGGVAMVDN